MCGLLLLVGTTWDLGPNNFYLEGPNSICKLNRNSQERTYLTIQKIIQLLHTLLNPYNGFWNSDRSKNRRTKGFKIFKIGSKLNRDNVIINLQIIWNINKYNKLV